MFEDVTWQEQLRLLYSLDHWWGYVARLATIVVLSVVVTRIAHYFVRRFFRAAVATNRIVVGERRARTLEGLTTSLTTFIVVIIAAIWALSQIGVSEGGLFTTLALFSAGLGLGARPLVSDYLAGITLLFEYSYAYGEKVEILDVMGTVEHVGLRVTYLRADTGELFVVPNGDVRVIRNFSRGAFSPASVRVSVAPKDVPEAIAVLEQVAEAAMERHADLLYEKPEVISETGDLGPATQLTILARAKFGQGAKLRPLLMQEAQEALEAAGLSEAV
jgi:moderate conductance mechanosensitive channel